jgi:formylglycine-generating enzyme required for sulfatase activity
MKANPREELNIRVAIIQLVQKKHLKPALPDGLDEIMGQAKYILQNGTSKEDFAKAAEAYRQASLLAPWEADIYYNLALMREKAGETIGALIDYNFYLLARPNAPDKKAVKEKIGGLEYASQTTFKAILSPGHGLMAFIPAGQFWMGSPDKVGDGDEHPRHQVYLNAYYIDKYLVTFDDYDKFCDATNRSKPEASVSGRGRYPVINVSWNDASAYAKWVGKRLPTEAEWEKAARGGTDTKWFFGDDDSQRTDYGWYDATLKNFGDAVFPSYKTVYFPVGQKKPNPFGLYDVTGLITEWCSDWYNSQYYKTSPSQNPQGPATGNEKVLRGGSGLSTDARSANRFWRKGPDYSDAGAGFRCVMDPPPDDPALKTNSVKTEDVSVEPAAASSGDTSPESGTDAQTGAVSGEPASGQPQPGRRSN